MKQTDTPSQRLPDLHDLSPAEIEALPLWARCCYFIQPFNAGGRADFKSIEDWASLFGYQSADHALELEQEARRLLAFVEALRSEKKACPVGSNPLDCSTRSCDACFRLDATKYHETASSALVDGDLATQRDISDRCVPSATNAPPIPETSQEVHDTLIDAERYRWFRNECDWERRIVIAEYAEDGGQLDHHIDKARCGL